MYSSIYLVWLFCGKICVIYGKEGKVAKTKCQDIYNKKTPRRFSQIYGPWMSLYPGIYSA